MKIEKLKISSLIPYVNNAKIMTERDEFLLISFVFRRCYKNGKRN